MAALTPLSVDGMIVAASTALLADSRSGGRGGLLPWALLVTGSVASLAANVAVAEPTATGRVIAAGPSFALIGSYELLMRQIRSAAGQHPREEASSAAPQCDESGQSREPSAAPLPLPALHSMGLAEAGSCNWRLGSGHWLVLDVPGDGPCVVAAVDAAHEPQGHVDAGRNALAGDQVPVDYVTGVADDGDLAAGRHVEPKTAAARIY